MAIGVVAVVAGLTLPLALPSPPPAKLSAVADTGASGSLAYSTSAMPEPFDARSMLIRLTLGTAIVLALCVGTLWYCRRWLTSASKPLRSGDRRLHLLESMALPNRCAVHLVKLGHHSILVGADSSGLRMIVPLTEPFDQGLATLENTDQDAADREGPPALRAYRAVAAGIGESQLASSVP
jgi:flagellar biogenesis protein FliO